MVAKIQRNRIEGSCIRTAIDAIAERDFIANGFIADPPQLKMDFKFPDAGTEKRCNDLAMYTLGREILTAPIFLWRTNILEAALEYPLPDHVFGSAGWPYPKMWWTYETPRGPDQDNALEAGLLVQHDDGIYANWLVSGRRIRTQEIKYGTKVSSENFAEVGNLLQLIAFLNSRYVKALPERLDRATRRQLARAGEPEKAEETVRVVDLRTIKQEASKSAEGRQIDWSHRWWVRGHIRAQWYPSTQSHKLISIFPHLKGPEDKPIAEKVYRVIR
jgi:hypothetical protein